MRRAARLPILLAAGLLLAGCTADDEPEESTELQDWNVEESTEPPAEGSTGATATPPPAAPAEPTRAPAPAASPAAPPPAPAPVAPAPASPAPAAPAPAPTPPPPATASPTPTPPAWPREGSRVTYRVTVLSGSPDGYYNQDAFTNWTWTYANGDWTGRCEGTHVYGPYAEPQTREPISATFTAADPPHWPPMNTRSPPAVGETMTTWDLFHCEISPREARYAGMDDGWHTATDFDDGSPDDYLTAWDPDTGLVHHWEQWRRNTHSWGEMTSRT